MNIYRQLPKNLHRKTGVYSLENLKDGKIYIGSTSDKLGFYKRLSHHIRDLRNNRHKNKGLQDAWNLYGEENFIFKIRTICPSTYALKFEQIYLNIILKAQGDIKIFWSLGYNLSPSTDSTKRFKFKPYQRKNISNSLKGKPSPRKGIPNPNMAKENHPLWGKHHSRETLIKMSKPVLQYSLDGEFIKEWEALSIATIDLKLNASDIKHSLDGVQNSAGGFMWKNKIENYPLKIEPYKTNCEYIHPIRKIIQYDSNGNFVKIWSSINKASKNLNIDASSITKCCKNKFIHSKNIRFQYYSDDYLNKKLL